MSRSLPHPLALFSLAPYNERAKEVVNHPINRDFVSALKDGRLALDIGHIRSRSGNTTLATMGRGDVDIFVEGSSIAKYQCSFEIDLETTVVMFYDKSHSLTSQVFGENATPFEYGRLRKVVVHEELNTIIGIGGQKRDLVQFELKWHYSLAETMKRVKSWTSIPLKENSRFARTIDEADTALPSRRQTRPHTPAQPKMRYTKIGDMLGAGQFAVVHKAVDVDSGKLMAVKILKHPVGSRKQQQKDWERAVYYALKREVEHLANISHPCIVDYITSQGWEGPEVEIFMGLKEGTLESLIESGSNLPVTETVFHQMLQALDCLSLHDVVHRDVKPENILYVTRPNHQYQFQLGDFGMCNRIVSARTSVGSPLFMAPEMFERGEQTHKVDVWSLYVTMLWTLDVEGFRQKRFKSNGELHKTVLSVASNDNAVSKIREMAILKPGDRASAAQMLVKCFDGVGLSTSRSQVPGLNNNPKIANSKAAVTAVLVSRTGAVQQKPKNLSKGATATIAAGQYRVGKLRHAEVPRGAFGPALTRRMKYGLATADKHRIPGSFPSDGKITSEERCSGPQEQFCVL